MNPPEDHQDKPSGSPPTLAPFEDITMTHPLRSPILRARQLLPLLCLLLAAPASAAEPAAPSWLKGKAYKIPSEYTNQESGYFSIVEGQNGRLYVGAAKYG